MAITRLGHIKENKKGKNPNQGIRYCINYIINPLKTENYKYIGSNNVILTSHSQKIVKEGYRQFMATKEVFDKTLGRQAYHYKLSFAEEDDISPELAMQITKEFCEIYLANYESVYSVHTNTKHIHSHICFNSINMLDGKKYYYKNGDWKKYIQPVVNDLCSKYKLSYIELKPSEDLTFTNKKNKKKYGNYGQWLNDKDDNERKAKSKKPYYSYAMIRKDVDEAAYQAKTYAEFKSIMTEKGYKVEDENKYISFLAPGRTKVVRSYQLTPDKCTYTRENINMMIEGTFETLDRKEIINKLTDDFRVFLTTDRVNISRNKKKSNLEFAQAEEAVRMVYKHGFKTEADVRNYLTYINQADKELNIIKKQANISIERYLEYSDSMKELLDLIPQVSEYYTNGNYRNAYERALTICQEFKTNGINPNELYKERKDAEQLIYHIDKFKKKLFVDKIVCNRILSKKTVDYVKQIQRKREEI